MIDYKELWISLKAELDEKVKDERQHPKFKQFCHGIVLIMNDLEKECKHD